jgi:hypothetical protein
MLLTMALAATLPSPPPITVLRIPSDAEACDKLSAMAADIMFELPKMVDTSTRSDGLVVLCTTRTVNYSFFIGVTEAEFREGWKDRKQAQWNEQFCAQPQLNSLVRRGWRFRSTITFLSGERHYLTATCD